MAMFQAPDDMSDADSEKIKEEIRAQFSKQQPMVWVCHVDDEE